MSLSRIRSLVRIAAGVFGAVAVVYGGSSVRAGDAYRFQLALFFLLIIVATWAVVETIAAGFDQVGRTTKERYDQLEKLRPTAYAIAAQTVLACVGKQAAEDFPNVKVLRR